MMHRIMHRIRPIIPRTLASYREMNAPMQSVDNESGTIRPYFQYSLSASGAKTQSEKGNRHVENESNILD
jgi:hypothetical protein